MKAPLDAMASCEMDSEILARALDKAIVINPSLNSSMALKVFCDADQAFDPDDRRSTLGLCVFFGSKLISWQSKEQHIVSRFSIEVEYRSLTHVTAEMTWITSLLMN